LKLLAEWFQQEEHLPSKCKALRSNPSATKKKIEKEKFEHSLSYIVRFCLKKEMCKKGEWGESQIHTENV
jgi:hypothetical protein